MTNRMSSVPTTRRYWSRRLCWDASPSPGSPMTIKEKSPPAEADGGAEPTDHHRPDGPPHPPSPSLGHREVPDPQPALRPPCQPTPGCAGGHDDGERQEKGHQQIPEHREPGGDDPQGGPIE